MVQKKPAVGDLFCGAGGFSEGFQQAGFRIRWALDNWKAAQTTYHNNHPNQMILEDDISNVNFRKLPRVDVLIGGPPCTYFSLANKAGNGHVKLGLELVQKFTEAVEALKPKYWVMENVPQLGSILESGRTRSEHGISRRQAERISKYLPSRVLLNAADFGVPQKRRRLFYGNFPLPKPTSPGPEGWIPMKKVIEALPYPLSNPSLDRKVADPLYDGIRISAHRLTDHFMDTTMDEIDIELSRRGKLDHFWGGPMAFPDSLDKPARSITARTSKSTRQTIVIRENRGLFPVYRIPTIRESASLQGFPITYQFWGHSRESRYTLVGNAVPPPVARGFAHAIWSDIGLGGESEAKIFNPRLLSPTPSLVPNSPRHRLLLGRPCRSYIPGTIRYSCRVDLDNRGASPEMHPTGVGKHLVRWGTTLTLGYARNYAAFRIDFGIACRIALLLARRGEAELSGVLDRLVRHAANDFAITVPDASTLQAIWSKRLELPYGPDWLVGRISAACVTELERNGLRGNETKMIAKDFFPLLREVKQSSGKDSRKARWKKEMITFYAGCCLVVTSIAAIFANQGATWLRQNWAEAYRSPPNIPVPVSMSLTGLGPEQVITAFSQLAGSSLRQLHTINPRTPDFGSNVLEPIESRH